MSCVVGLRRVNGTDIMRILRRDLEVRDMVELGSILVEVFERRRRAEGSQKRRCPPGNTEDYSTARKGWL